MAEKQTKLTVRQKAAIVEDRTISKFLLLTLGELLSPRQAAARLDIDYGVFLALRRSQPELDLAWRVHEARSDVAALEKGRRKTPLAITRDLCHNLFEEHRLGAYLGDMIDRSWAEKEKGEADDDMDMVDVADDRILNLFRSGAAKDLLVKQSAGLYQEIKSEEGDLANASIEELRKLANTVTTERMKIEEVVEEAADARRRHQHELTGEAVDVEFTVDGGTPGSHHEDPGEPDSDQEAGDRQAQSVSSQP